MTDDIYETPSSTPNFQTELAEKLADLAPEAIADGKIDVVKLQELLADDAAEISERFGLFWPGKHRALRTAQMPTTATLNPDIANSKDWETTKNVFIEGDNLEVLKILQKHYHGKIKMIYIDPPYNTGKDFVYPDNYKEGLESYLEWTKQVSEEGKKLSTNSESEGRYHSNWLNMMYPRLKLARDLIKSDGHIFVSINDFEMPRLRSLMDEIFGEANFIAQLVWLKGKEGGNDNPGFGLHHEYILCYGKNPTLSPESITLGEKDTSRHVRTLPGENRVVAPTNEYRRGELFQLVNLSKQKDYQVVIPLKDGTTIDWPSYAPQKTIDEYIKIGKVFVGSKGVPYVKSFLADEAQGSKPSTILDSKFGTTKSGGIALRNIFGSSKVFSYPKPPSLIKKLMEFSMGDGENSRDEIVLDFFAGSGSTAHAVMEANAEDKGSRRFVLVQLPEPTEPLSESGNLSFKTIADITRKRIASVAVNLGLEHEKQLDGFANRTDLGFRSFRLQDSNFTKWNFESGIEPSRLGQELLKMKNSASDQADELATLVEILIKQGNSLSDPIEKIRVAELDLFSVGDGLVLAYLNGGHKPSLEALRQVLSEGPSRFIILEDAFQGDDELKTNVHQICRSKSIELWTA